MDTIEPAASPAPGQPLHRWLACAIAVLVTLVVCWGTTGLGWTNWDDGKYVYENPAVLHGDAGTLWSSTIMGGYTPLTVSTFALEWQATSGSKSLSGRAYLFHLDNLLLHLLCTGLTFWLLARLGVGLPWAAAGAVLFGIHPMHVESFAWITERKDVLYGTFYLGALLAYLRYQDTEKRPWLVLVGVLMVLGLLSKIMVVALPLSLLLLDWFRGRAVGRRWIWEKVPFLALALIAGLLQFVLMDSEGTLDRGATHGLLNRLLLGGGVWGKYLGKFLIPHPLSPVYPVPDPVPFLDGLFGLIALTVTGAAIYFRKRWPWLTFGMLFFLVNIIFLLQFIGGGLGFLSDRYTYIAYLGLIFIAAKGLEALANRQMVGKVLAWGLATLGLAAFAYVTRTQIQVWRDSATLWTSVINHFPDDGLAYGKRADHYLAEGKYDLALHDYEAALERAPSEPRYLLAQGHLHFLAGDSAQALAAFQATAAHFAPYEAGDWEQATLRLAVFNQGVLHMAAGRPDSALAAYDLLLTHVPDDTLARMNRAAIHFGRGAYQLAATDYESVVQHCIVDATYQSMLGQCYFQLAALDRAVSAFTAAIGGEPGNGLFYLQRANAYRALGDQGSARADALKARSLGIALDSTWSSISP